MMDLERRKSELQLQLAQYQARIQQLDRERQAVQTEAVETAGKIKMLDELMLGAGGTNLPTS